MVADAVIVSAALNGLWVWLLAWGGQPYGVRAGRAAASVGFGLLTAWLVAHGKGWFPFWALRPPWFPEGLWTGIVEAALFEETSKALVLLVCFALLRPQSHFEALVLGVGLGAGFGLYEDAGYILRGVSLAGPESYYRTLFSVALARSVPVHAALNGLVSAGLYKGPAPAGLALLAAVAIHGGWNITRIPLWEKGFLILLLLGAEALWAFWKSWKLYPRIEARWERGWVALLTPWEPQEPQGLEGFLSALFLFVFALGLVAT